MQTYKCPTKFCTVCKQAYGVGSMSCSVCDNKKLIIILPKGYIKTPDPRYLL